MVYLGCGVIGWVFGDLWAPPDAGASLAGAGLVGAASAWPVSPVGPRQVEVLVWGVLWPLAGIALTVRQDMHGPPLPVDFGLGTLLLWLHRRGPAGDRPGGAVGPDPPAVRRCAQPRRKVSLSHPGRPGPAIR